MRAEIRNQETYPYCGLYAMAAFLEMWGNSTREPSRRLPPIDPAFLAFMYNIEIGSGTCGTITPWLQLAVMKYGVVPLGATLGTESRRWQLRERWHDFHGGLMERAQVQSILLAQYEHRELNRPFYPLEYLDTLGVDFRQLRRLVTNHMEAYQAVPSSGDTARYRDATVEATQVRMAKELEDLGLGNEALRVAPGDLFDSLLVQIYRGKPVLASVNVGVLPHHLKDYTLVTGPTLVPAGEGTQTFHAVVAVAHCNRQDTSHPLCKRFAPLMKQLNVPEVIVFHNSWGPQAHGVGHGYFALSRAACERMLTHATVFKDIAASCGTRLDLAVAAAAEASVAGWPDYALPALSTN